MIVYNFEFEELKDGTFRVHWESPVGTATPKEIAFAKAFMAHNKEILAKIKDNLGGGITSIITTSTPARSITCIISGN